MRRHWAAKGLMFAVFGVAFVFVFGYVVMHLWNWLLPTLFGAPLTFWKAVGLLVLCRILFGGFRGGRGGPMHWRHRMKERWEHMTPEEREKFRQRFGDRCGSFGHGPKESKVSGA
ncbi:MAG TPA: hypothetical protein VKR59_20480 [Terriglobales bacterium]|jgi:hypothetical protein|nr:hypothetical protein [Terriglobales bacterium]